MLINMNNVDHRMSSLISRLNFDAGTQMVFLDVDRLADSILLVTGITITPEDNSMARRGNSPDVSAMFMFNSCEIEVLLIRYFRTFDRVMWTPSHTENVMDVIGISPNIDYKLFIPRMSNHVRSP